MLSAAIARFEAKLDAFMGSLPEYIPITAYVAKEMGYSRVDHLTKAAKRELEPDVEIIHDGHRYLIKTSALWKIKR